VVSNLDDFECVNKILRKLDDLCLIQEANLEKRFQFLKDILVRNPDRIIGCVLMLSELMQIKTGIILRLLGQDSNALLNVVEYETQELTKFGVELEEFLRGLNQTKEDEK